VHLAYISDHPYPRDATDTAQIIDTCAALGRAGARVTLHHLVRDADESSAPSAATIAEAHGVSPTFASRAHAIRSIVRGPEKLRFARQAVVAAIQSGADVIYSRNLPAVLEGVRRGHPTFFETYRPWPAQSATKAALFRRLHGRDALRGLVLHSEYAARSYRALGYSEARTRVALNAFDPQHFAGLDAASERATLGWDATPTVTYAGDLSPRKGVGVVLELARRLPATRFALVGSRDANGPIERAAAELANVEVLTFRPVEDVARVLVASDVLVIPPTEAPLRRAGHTVLPIKTFQYLAAGRAILAGDTPDLLELLTDDQNARVTPPDDVDAAVAALEHLLADDALRGRLAAGARETAQQHTWDARARRILAFVEERLADSGLPRPG
jgi:glycosyltransferase involved in cell wall biosynthesis